MLLTFVDKRNQWCAVTFGIFKWRRRNTQTWTKNEHFFVIVLLFFLFFLFVFFGHSLSKKKDESYLLLRTTVVYFTIMWLRMYEVINSFCISFSRPFLWSITETTPCTCYAPVLWHLTTINLLLYCSCHQFPEHCANSSFSSFWCWFGWRNQWRETSWVLTLQLLGLKKISRTQII